MVDIVSRNYFRVLFSRDHLLGKNYIIPDGVKIYFLLDAWSLKT